MSLFSSIRSILKKESPSLSSENDKQALYIETLSDEDRQAAVAVIVETLVNQKESRIKRGLYWENQIAFAYNSNKIEGNELTSDQTRAIFETNSLSGDIKNIDHVTEMRNHFRMFDYMLDTIDQPLSAELIQDFHRKLKSGTVQSDSDDIGEWKLLPNGVDGIDTVPPGMVDRAIKLLLEDYSSKPVDSYKKIADFHIKFERIHPFQDGNGRVGRMIAFRECLKAGLIPFIVLDESRKDYYSALRNYKSNPQMLCEYFSQMAEMYYQRFSHLVPESDALIKLKIFRSSEVLKYFEEPTKTEDRKLSAIEAAKDAARPLFAEPTQQPSKLR